MRKNEVVKPALETPRSPYAVGSYGPLVCEWARRRVSLDPGPWQEYALGRILEHDPNGDLIASEALVSTGRQNGKTTIVRSLIGWVLDEGIKLPAFEQWRHLLTAAHDSKQARYPYEQVQRDMLGLYVPNYYGGRKRRGEVTSAKERLRITDYFGIEINGVVLDTATSQPGSARGISPGLIAWDEMLTQKTWDMWEALSPSQSAIRNALMLLTSTAGHMDSVVLRALYERLQRQVTGAEQADPSFVGLWWCADDDDVGIDWEQLRKANPALDDGRLSRKRIEAEYNTLPAASWTRERLNRWADERAEPAFSLAAWGECRTSDSLRAVPGPFALGIDCTADLTAATIAVSAPRADGRVGVEIHRHFEGSSSKQISGESVTAVISAFAEKYRIKDEGIVYPSNSALAPALERHAATTGLPYRPLSSPSILQACADFEEAIGSKRLAHDDPLLDQQMMYAQRRYVGGEGAWRWAVTASPGEITAVQAATFATAAAAKVPIRAQVFL